MPFIEEPDFMPILKVVSRKRKRHMTGAHIIKSQLKRISGHNLSPDLPVLHNARDRLEIGRKPVRDGLPDLRRHGFGRPRALQHDRVRPIDRIGKPARGEFVQIKKRRHRLLIGGFRRSLPVVELSAFQHVGEYLVFGAEIMVHRADADARRLDDIADARGSKPFAEMTVMAESRISPIRSSLTRKSRSKFLGDTRFLPCGSVLAALCIYDNQPGLKSQDEPTPHAEQT